MKKGNSGRLPYDSSDEIDNESIIWRQEKAKVENIQDAQMSTKLHDCHSKVGIGRKIFTTDFHYPMPINLENAPRGDDSETSYRKQMAGEKGKNTQAFSQLPSSSSPSVDALVKERSKRFKICCVNGN